MKLYIYIFLFINLIFGEYFYVQKKGEIVCNLNYTNNSFKYKKSNKKLIYKYNEIGELKEIKTFNYNNSLKNKIIVNKKNRIKKIYKYFNNNISEIFSFKDNKLKEKIIYKNNNIITEKYKYNNNLLINTDIYINNNFQNKKVFFYKNNRNIKTEIYDKYGIVQIIKKEYSNINIKYKNKNINVLKIKEFFYDKGNNLISTDSKYMYKGRLLLQKNKNTSTLISYKKNNNKYDLDYIINLNKKLKLPLKKYIFSSDFLYRKIIKKEKIQILSNTTNYIHEYIFLNKFNNNNKIIKLYYNNNNIYQIDKINNNNFKISLNFSNNVLIKKTLLKNNIVLGKYLYSYDNNNRIITEKFFYKNNKFKSMIKYVFSRTKKKFNNFSLEFVLNNYGSEGFLLTGKSIDNSIKYLYKIKLKSIILFDNLYNIKSYYKFSNSTYKNYLLYEISDYISPGHIVRNNDFINKNIKNYLLYKQIGKYKINKDILDEKEFLKKKTIYILDKKYNIIAKLNIKYNIYTGKIIDISSEQLKKYKLTSEMEKFIKNKIDKYKLKIISKKEKIYNKYLTDVLND